MTDKATETPQAAPAVGSQVDRGVRPGSEAHKLTDRQIAELAFAVLRDRKSVV